MNVLNIFKKRQAERTTDARTRYQQALQQLVAGDPAGKEAERLASVLDQVAVELGLDAEQVEVDAALVRELATLADVDARVAAAVNRATVAREQSDAAGAAEQQRHAAALVELRRLDEEAHACWFEVTDLRAQADWAAKLRRQAEERGLLAEGPAA